MNSSIFPNGITTRVEYTCENIYTIKALRDFSKLPINNEELRRISCSSLFSLINPVEQTMAMITNIFFYLCSNGKEIPFLLSGNTLYEQVRKIDMLPKPLGFFHDSILLNECNFIVPNRLEPNCDLYQLIEPIKIWRMNYYQLHCPMIGVALLLLLIHICLFHVPALSKADWTPFIGSIAGAPIEELSMRVNNAVEQMLKSCNEVE